MTASFALASGAILAAMITAKQCHQLLLADRTRDATWITAAIEHLLATDPTVTLLDIELALRDGGAYSYLSLARTRWFRWCSA